MRPVAKGIAGGLLLSLVVVVGLSLLSGISPSEGSAPGVQVHFVASVTSIVPAMSTTTTATGSIAGPAPVSAAKSDVNATISTVQTKPSYSVVLTFLPLAAALALGASVYLISRNRIEKEA